MIPGLNELFRILQISVRVSKAQKILLMPSRVDKAGEGSTERIRRFLDCFYGSYLGCSRGDDFKKVFTFQTIAEVKTHFIETRIKSNFEKANPFLRSCAVLGAKLGLADQAILLQIPAVAVVRNNILQLQEDFELLRSAYWDSDEDIVFNKIIHSGLDPERVLTTRSAHVILEANAALVNHYTG